MAEPAAAPAATPAPAAPSAPAAPAAAPAVPAPAAAPAPFADSLPAEIRADGAFRDIKDLAGLAKSYVHAQKLLGNRDPKTLFAIPGADDDKAWGEVYDALGRPASHDKYELPQVQLPDGLAIDDALKGEFLKTAHANGLSTRQAAKLYEWYNAQAAARWKADSDAAQRGQADGLAALKTEFGQAFDAKIDLAHKALAHYSEKALGPKAGAFIQYLEQTRLGDNPEMVKVFAAMGAALQEDGLIGKGGPGTGIRTPTEAQQEISALNRDQVFMKDYRDKRAPGHTDAVARMEGLYKQAYPD